MKKIIKLILLFGGVIGLFLVALILFATITDYKPDKKTIVFQSNNPTIINPDSELSLMIWNIGYCGLGADMDFFYDGGEQVRTSQKNLMQNLKSVNFFLTENQSLDFILLQEVDKLSKRSYYTDEFSSILNSLTNFHGTFGLNYNVKFVPLPFTSPLGKVYSGLGTFSRNIPKSSVRYTFPGNYQWPKRLFMLDRCFLVNRYPVSNGKELLIINTHNSAYDDGRLKQRQMDYLKSFLTAEYNKGNYIVVAGDWNQCPPGFSPGFDKNIFDTKKFSMIKTDYLPDDWTWFYDDKTPSNRRLYKPYEPDNSYVTVIDYYLLSPNIKGLYNKTENLEFNNSDHQPVFARLKLQ